MKVFIFDFDGTLYSGKDIFKKLPEFIALHQREFFPNLTDEQYNILVNENSFWKDVHVGSDIVDAIYLFKDKYPNWQIDIKDFWNWQNKTLEPIIIDKSNIVDINFLQKICKQFPVYLVSNSSPNHIKYYLNYIGINYKIFKKIISNRFTKKDRTKKHYYKDILKIENCQPNDVFVLGDSVKNDLIPAEKLGINTIFVDDATKIKSIVTKIIKSK